MDWNMKACLCLCLSYTVCCSLYLSGLDFPRTVPSMGPTYLFHTEHFFSICSAYMEGLSAINFALISSNNKYCRLRWKCVTAFQNILLSRDARGVCRHRDYISAAAGAGRSLEQNERGKLWAGLVLVPWSHQCLYEAIKRLQCKKVARLCNSMLTETKAVCWESCPRCFSRQSDVVFPASFFVWVVRHFVNAAD